jgi:hypothetical protein
MLSAVLVTITEPALDGLRNTLPSSFPDSFTTTIGDEG